MSNPLDIIVASTQVAAAKNPNRTTVNPLAQQVALGVQAAAGSTAVLPPATVTEPVVVTQITRATTAEDLRGGSANQLAVQTAQDTTAFISAPQTEDRYLYWDGLTIQWAPVSIDYLAIVNRPTIPAAQIPSDWNQTTNTALDFIKNKPTITAQIQSDWTQATNTSLDFIKNKPTIPAAQIQSDWTQATNTALDFIKNKPTLATGSAKTVAVSGQTSVDLALDGTLTLAAGNGIVLTTNNSTKTVTIARKAALTGQSASSGTFTMDCSLYDAWAVSLTGAVTLSFSNIPAGPALFVAYVYVTQGTGGSIAAFPTGTTWPGAVAPSLTTTANRTDVFAFSTTNGGGKWFASVVGQNYT